MQETFIVTVQTEDGKCLIQEKTTGDYLDLCVALSRLSLASLRALKDSLESETQHGSGTTLSRSASSSPTEP